MNIARTVAILASTSTLAVGAWAYHTQRKLDSELKQGSELQSRIERLENDHSQRIHIETAFGASSFNRQVAVPQNEPDTAFGETNETVENDEEEPLPPTAIDPAERDAEGRRRMARYFGKLDRMVDGDSNSDWHPERALASDPAFAGSVDQVRCGNGVCRLRARHRPSVTSRDGFLEEPPFAGLSVNAVYDYDSDPEYVTIYVAPSSDGLPKL